MRPSEFTRAIADQICGRLAEGKSLREICAAEDMPDRSTVLRWKRSDEDFRSQYAQAREDQADAHADEILDISDDVTLKPEDRRVRIDARKWKAAKQRPKVYGDSIDHKHSGEVLMTHEQRLALLK